MKSPLTLALAAAVAISAVAPLSAAQAQPRHYRYDDADAYYRDACREKRRDRRAAGAILGGIAGAVIGSNVDDDGNRSEGTVIGAVAGAAAGSHIAGKSTKCDRDGAYWSYGETYGYSDRYYYRGSRRDDWYERRRCRWAQDWRGDYVRVCPDSRGRFRIVR